MKWFWRHVWCSWRPHRWEDDGLPAWTLAGDWHYSILTCRCGLQWRGILKPVYREVVVAERTRAGCPAVEDLVDGVWVRRGEGACTCR